MIFEFLSRFDSIKLQQLNKYFYHVAVSRAQPRVATAEKFHMVVSSGETRIAEIWRRRETYSLVAELSIETKKMPTVKKMIVGEHIVSLDTSIGQLGIYRIDGSKIKSRRLTIKLKESPFIFSICGYKNNSIFCTGGMCLVKAI